MTPGTRKLLERIESWPEEDRQELAEAALEIEARRAGVYRLTEAEREAVQRGLDDIEQNRFASDDDIAAIFRRARATRS
jgi:ParB-like chromosome segregation protein Spo0J